jgi:predicted MFS family arabinose efflux permease
MTSLMVAPIFDRNEWRSGWRVVVSGIAGTTMANLYVGTLGVLMPSLALRFGWSRAQLSASVLIVCAGLLLFGPAVAPLIARVGLRAVALRGAALYCIGLFTVGLTGPKVWTWYAAWTMVALANPAVNNTVWTTAVTRLYRHNRGLALSTALSGVGLASFIAPPLALWIADSFGWRAAYFSMAIGSLFLIVPSLWALFRPPDEPAESSNGARRVAPSPFDHRSLWAILDSSQFWRLAAGVVIVSAGIGTLLVHFQPIMRDAGVSGRTAAAFASILGPTSVVGRLIGGYILDRLPPRFVASGAFALPAFAAALLLHYDGSTASSVIAATAIGFSLGLEGDVVAYLTAAYFGVRNYSSSYALLFGLFAIGAGAAPVVAGAIFDWTGSYAVMLKLLITALGIASVMMVSLGPPKREEGQALSICAE